LNSSPGCASEPSDNIRQLPPAVEPMRFVRCPWPVSNEYSDLERHTENEQHPGILIFRPEANLINVNADAVLEGVLQRIKQDGAKALRLVVCDLSASPFMDLAGAAMLNKLHGEFAKRDIAFRIVDARSQVRELLRADGLAE
jgi:MFS superfamily sulfate permease-like transporter